MPAGIISPVSIVVGAHGCGVRVAVRRLAMNGSK